MCIYMCVREREREKRKIPECIRSMNQGLNPVDFKSDLIATASQTRSCNILGIFWLM